jgi:hypothetical protein
MGCGCKTNSSDKSEQISFNDKSLGSKNNENLETNLETNKPNPIVNYLFKIIGFFIGLLFLPIIVLAIIWFMFQLLVLNGDVDMKRIVLVLSSKLKRFNESNVDGIYYGDDDDDDDEEYDDEEEYDEENYEMLDVEDITPRTIK